jgi:hypothetical protein
MMCRSVLVTLWLRCTPKALRCHFSAEGAPPPVGSDDGRPPLRTDGRTDGRTDK